MSMYSDLDHKHEFASEATRVVKRHTNRVYSPILSSEEVAAHLSVDESTAREALEVSEETGYISKKRVGDADDAPLVWW